jgi:ABC-type phosphonate transport system ATPase subunit
MSVERLPRWLARPDWRRVLYGDWSCILRDPLDVLRLAFVAGAFASMGRRPLV